jgi:hypothetical protein
MAVPGETECQPVMACGEGLWGNIIVDATTIYVDAAYAGGANDGSSSQPFTTIADAVDAASPGALIAVAAGTYAEDVAIQKPVRLWGVCPDQAILTGGGGEVGAITLGPGATGAEVHGFSVAADNPTAVFVSGAEDVTLAHLWLHDGTGRGLTIESSLGATSVRAERVLVERAHVVGVGVVGADASFHEVVLRDILPRQSDQTNGIGMSIEIHPDTTAAEVAITTSVVERSHDAGILVFGSKASIEQTVVRDISPQPSDLQGGQGIGLQIDPASQAQPQLTATHVLVEAPMPSASLPPAPRPTWRRSSCGTSRPLRSTKRMAEASTSSPISEPGSRRRSPWSTRSSSVATTSGSWPAIRRWNWRASSCARSRRA